MEGGKLVKGVFSLSLSSSAAAAAAGREES